MAYVLEIDLELCTGCELCVERCPGVFQINDFGVAEVFNLGGDFEESIQEVIEVCPEQALAWGE